MEQIQKKLRVNSDIISFTIKQSYALHKLIPYLSLPLGQSAISHNLSSEDCN